MIAELFPGRTALQDGAELGFDHAFFGISMRRALVPAAMTGAIPGKDVFNAGDGCQRFEGDLKIQLDSRRIEGVHDDVAGAVAGYHSLVRLSTIELMSSRSSVMTLRTVS